MKQWCYEGTSVQLGYHNYLHVHCRLMCKLPLDVYTLLQWQVFFFNFWREVRWGVWRSHYESTNVGYVLLFSVWWLGWFCPVLTTVILWREGGWVVPLIFVFATVVCTLFFSKCTTFIITIVGGTVHSRSAV